MWTLRSWWGTASGEEKLIFLMFDTLEVISILKEFWPKNCQCFKQKLIYDIVCIQKQCVTLKSNKNKNLNQWNPIWTMCVFFGIYRNSVLTQGFRRYCTTFSIFSFRWAVLLFAFLHLFVCSSLSISLLCSVFFDFWYIIPFYGPSYLSYWDSWLKTTGFSQLQT